MFKFNFLRQFDSTSWNLSWKGQSNYFLQSSDNFFNCLIQDIVEQKLKYKKYIFFAKTAFCTRAGKTFSLLWVKIQEEWEAFWLIDIAGELKINNVEMREMGEQSSPQWRIREWRKVQSCPSTWQELWFQAESG